MANCINCGGELFETSKFCPHCGTPVLEVSDLTGNSKIKEYDNNDSDNNSEDGLPEVNSAELTPEEQAAVLEMAAEKVLEDIPFIKKLDDISVSPDNTISEKSSVPNEIHKEPAEKEASEPASDNESEKSEDKAQSEAYRQENDNSPAEPAKKSKGGIIAVIAVLAAAAIGGGVFFFSRTSEPAIVTVPDITTFVETVPESETVSETMETEASSEITTIPETEISSETVPANMTSAEELSSETELTDITNEAHTVDELVQGIIIEPEHSSAMGNEISAEIKLSEQGISHDILSSGVLFLAEYSTESTDPLNYTPAAMVMIINGTTIEVTATSCSEGMVIFEYDLMTAAAEAAGYTPADIDSVAIKSTGVPIDVFKITILQG